MEAETKRDQTPNKFELKYASLAPAVWEKLAQIPREGWVRRGVKQPETVQEHTIAIRNLVISIIEILPEFSPEDIQDILNMLEIHDYPEAIIGDEIVAVPDPAERERLKAEKFQKELAAMTQITKDMGEIGTEVFALWMRFEEENDPVSVFSNQIDKYQAMEKAFEYEKAGEKVSAMGFIKYYESVIVHPVLKQRLEDLKAKLNNGL